MKANVKTAIVLAFFVVVALISIVYAFVQQTEAKRQEELASHLRIEAAQQRAIAEEQKRIAVEALEACKSSKK